MKAYVRNKYGDPNLLKLKEVEKPIPTSDQVLIKVYSMSINPAEWHIMRGRIWLIRLNQGIMKPKHKILGGDVAGEVVEVGSAVNSVQIGDRVFGRAEHSAAGEFALLNETKLAVIPNGLSYSDSASLPLASITALDALNAGTFIGQGSKILINGASGGIGTLAIQIAKARGAHVHGISSSKNLDFISSLGADHVISYEDKNHLELDFHYDLVIDLVGNLKVGKILPLMQEKGVFVMVGYHNFKNLFFFILHSIISKKGQKLITLDAKTTNEKLNKIGQLVATKKIRPVVDKQFSFSSLPQAFAYLGTRRAKGKVVINKSNYKIIYFSNTFIHE